MPLNRSGRLLVLGGTGEARALCVALSGDARLSVTLSLAGRTSRPTRQPVATRIGGLGGVEGLAGWIAENRIGGVIDATHPFAARISANAAAACARTGTPLLAIRRPAWRRQEGDAWIEVDDMAAAAQALGPAPRRVFLTVGRQELAAFAAAPQHDYRIRTIEPIDPSLHLPRLTAIRARGPFSVEDETRVLREAQIETLVSKNSGGAATYAKIEAARALGLPVVMVRRPEKPEVACVETVEAALAWSRAHAPATQSMINAPSNAVP